MVARLRTDGFSLIEALVALSITAMAGSVLLLAVEGVLTTTNDAVDQTVAQGMATQLLDEVLGKRYSEGSSPYETNLGPQGNEDRGEKRDRYDDTDDYADYLAAPPKDIAGDLLGQGDGIGGSRPAALRSPTTEFSKWRQKVDVYYVSATDPTIRLPDNQPTDYRAVEVTIERTEADGGVRTLAKVRRVFCYVPRP